MGGGRDYTVTDSKFPLFPFLRSTQLSVSARNPWLSESLEPVTTNSISTLPIPISLQFPILILSYFPSFPPRYTVVIAQQLPLASKTTFKSITGSDDPSVHKLAALVPCVCFLIFPLSLLSDLAPLKYPSLAGLAFTAVSILIVIWDSLSAGFFGNLVFGAIQLQDILMAANKTIRLHWQGMTPDSLAQLALRVPVTASLAQSTFAGDFQLLPTLSIIALYSSAFACHYNSPRWYLELAPKYRNPRSYGMITAAAFAIVVFIFGAFAAAGYSRFGAFLGDNVLLQYGSLMRDDQKPGGNPAVISIAWVGIAFSVLFSFPLAFNSARLAYFEAFESLKIEGINADVAKQGLAGSSSKTGKMAYVGFTAGFCALALLGGWQIPGLKVPGAIKGFSTTCFLCGLFPGVMLYGKVMGWGSVEEEEEEEKEVDRGK